MIKINNLPKNTKIVKMSKWRNSAKMAKNTTFAKISQFD